MAGSVDSLEDTRPVAAEVGFPVAWGITRDMGDAIGAWWEDRRDHIQPSEFVMSSDGRLIASAYSSAPIGRLDPEETLSLMRFLNQRRQRKQ